MTARGLLPRAMRALWPAAALLLAAALALPCRAADDIDSKLVQEEARMRALERQISEHRQRVQQMGERAQGVVSRIEELDQKRSMTEQRIKVLELRNEKGKKSVEQLRTDIRATEQELASMKRVLEARLVDIYKYGGVAEFNLLLSASSAHEAMETTLLLNRIARQDEAMITDMLARKEKLETSIARLEEELKQIASNAAALDQNRKTYRKEIADSNAYLQKVRTEQALHQRAVQELQDSQREIQATIMELMKKKREAEMRPDPQQAQRPPREEVPVGGKLAWPLPSRGEIVSKFGMRVHPTFKTKIMHTGIDIRMPAGTPVYAAGPGEVLYAGWLRGYGQIVIIDHGRNLSSVYAHLSRLDVGEGARVRKGQNIGQVGSTGVATGAHLHFEVRVNGEARDPMGFLGK